MSTQTRRAAGATPDDVGPSDLERRGTPAGLAPPTELEELHPDGTFVLRSAATTRPRPATSKRCG